MSTDLFRLPRRHRPDRLAPPWLVEIASALLLLLHCLPAPTVAFGGFLADFEGIDGAKSYAPWRLHGDNLALVPGGPGGEGHCLKAERTEPASHCGIRIEGPIVLEKNLLLAFDYRVEIEAGFEGAYLGMILYVDGKQWFFRSKEFSGRWNHAESSMEPVEADGALGVRFRAGKRTHLVLSRRQAGTGPMEGGGLQCDGEAAAIELDEQGKPIRAMAIQATYLRYNGRTIQTSQAPTDWAGQVEETRQKKP